MSRQIHIPNFNSISQRTTEKSPENRVDGHQVDWWTDRQIYWLKLQKDSKETYSPPGFTGRGLKTIWKRIRIRRECESMYASKPDLENMSGSYNAIQLHLCCWVGLFSGFYITLTIFQSHLHLEEGHPKSLKSKVVRAEFKFRPPRSASQELNHTITDAPQKHFKWQIYLPVIFRVVEWFCEIFPVVGTSRAVHPKVILALRPVFTKHLLCRVVLEI